jgi:uncharacterized membrane protein YedE/YeeE
LLLNRRIAGISGILFGLLAPAQGEVAWRILFIIGLVSCATAYRVINPTDVISIDASWPLLIIGGPLVGLCPGPALSSFAYLMPENVIFVAAMLAEAAQGRLLP